MATTAETRGEMTVAEHAELLKKLGSRCQPGGDLYMRPLTAAEMTAPLAWHEDQMATAWRFGVLADGRIGYARVK